MDTVLLRKLTLKSKFRFGKHHDLTVQSLINSRGYKGLDYITKIYYGCSNITFMPEILEMCGITRENEIAKPGKVEHNPTRWDYIKIAMRNRIEKEDPQERVNQRKSNVRLGGIVGSINANGKRLQTIHQSRRTVLQAKNHGR